MNEAKINERKRKEVEDIKTLFRQNSVMGIANLEKLPAFNLMKIKSSLRGAVVLKYTKKRLMKIAFDEMGDEKLSVLKDKLAGIPALIFTNEEPFKLYQVLKKSKSNSPAKAGDIAPVDIVVPAGPTDFTPGPMIGELGALGIKTGVEGGKIVIKTDKLLVRAGEEINSKNAELMSKLKMTPMEIGLNLVLTYERGEILERNVLDIDIEVYENNIKQAVIESLNLAVYSEYITKESVEIMIRKAVIEAGSLEHTSNFKEKLAELKDEPESHEEEPVTASVIEDSEPVGEKNIKTDNLEPNEPRVKPQTEAFKKENEENDSVDAAGFSEDLMKQAQEKLKELTDKKLRGYS